MSEPKASTAQQSRRSTLLLWLLLIHGAILAAFAVLVFALHQAHSQFRSDLVRAEYLGSVIYGIVASHLTAAPTVNPPNDLGISVRKIGDFLDDGMRTEQTIDLPATRIGADWPPDIRVRSASAELSEQSIKALSNLSYAEEFFVELSLALMRHREEARLIANLDQSIAIAFETEVWTRRNDPDRLRLLASGAAIGLLALWFWSLKWTSNRIRSIATALSNANKDQSPPDSAKLEEFQAVERAMAEIIASNEERDAERIKQLAAMSHDLNTPFTRIRLHAELFPDDSVRTDMLRDLDEIDVMIDESMRFLKREDQREEIQVIDIVSLVQSLCDDAADLGDDVVYRDVLDTKGSSSSSNRIWVNARPFALRRAIMNVIQNAVRYGGKAEVRIRLMPEMVEVLVDDPGDGIPKKYWDTISMPFKRVEESRSRGTGGMGLGLATAKSVIDALGGRLQFSFTDDSWFRVSISVGYAEESGVAKSK